MQNTMKHLLLSKTVSIKIDLEIPTKPKNHKYDKWAKIFLNQAKWIENKSDLTEYHHDSDDVTFIFSVIKLFREICEIGRLPILEMPKITKILKNTLKSNRYLTEIEFYGVDQVDNNLYKIPLDTALIVCASMYQNRPTFELKTRVFNIIEQNAIKPLHALAPGGESSIPILKTANSMGIPFLHLGAGVYALGWGSKSRRMDRSTTDLDPSIGAKLSHNKVVASNLIRRAGLPAPTHMVASREVDAVNAAGKLGFPVVIKPIDRDRGEGITVDLDNELDVKQAFSKAQLLSKTKKVIIERQVEGICHRLFIAGGNLLYAVKRGPMSIMCDGRRTISELVDNEVLAQREKAPWHRTKIQAIDQRAIEALAHVGLSPKSIPEKGVLAPLRRIESTEDGGIDEEVTCTVHPENIAIATTAAKLFGLHVAGIDIISADISKPWYENDAIINEVNFAPLFGGGEISRSYIQKFLSEYIDGDGRIPVEQFNDQASALQKQHFYISQGMRCYLTTGDTTIDFSGAPVPMPFKDINQRIRALLCRSDVDAIVFCTAT